MAKISAGILSAPRGKVAGVVGATWKGISYVRALVTPANPQTTSQQAQRNKMKTVVSAAQSCLASVLIPYVSPFQKKMSGYNYFIKKNIGAVADGALGSPMVLTVGTLPIPLIKNVGVGAETSVDGSYTPSADTANGEIDAIIVCLYRPSTNTFTVSTVTNLAATNWEYDGSDGWKAETGDRITAFAAVLKEGLATIGVSNNAAEVVIA